MTTGELMQQSVIPPQFVLNQIVRSVQVVLCSFQFVVFGATLHELLVSWARGRFDKSKLHKKFLIFGLHFTI